MGKKKAPKSDEVDINLMTELSTPPPVLSFFNVFLIIRKSLLHQVHQSWQDI